MTTLWTLITLQAALPHATIHSTGNPSFASVALDSREVIPTALFVALKGVSSDGHAHLNSAITAGAGGVVISDPSQLPPDRPADLVIVHVADTQSALESLAVYARQHIPTHRIAVTGSVGKTTLKDLLQHSLSGLMPTWANVKSYNNKWGVPVTLANVPPTTQCSVFEVGTNGPGQISPLSHLIAPHIAVITTIGVAHIGHFGSQKALSEEKSCILNGLVAGGYAVLPRDVSTYAHLADKAASQGADIISFGVHPEATIQVLNVATVPQGTVIDLNIRGDLLSVTVPLLGSHWGNLIAAVFSVGLALNIAPASLIPYIQTFQEPLGRGRLLRLMLNNNPATSCTFIDHSYNANPQSMRLALEVVQNFPVNPGGRRIALVGDMLELGDDATSRHEHAQLIDHLDPAKLSLLITLGDHTQALHTLAQGRIAATYHATTVPEALHYLSHYVRPGDVIMAKASSSVFFHKLRDLINPMLQGDDLIEAFTHVLEDLLHPTHPYHSPSSEA